jgi:hypothetical protein
MSYILVPPKRIAEHSDVFTDSLNRDLARLCKLPYQVEIKFDGDGPPYVIAPELPRVGEFHSMPDVGAELKIMNRARFTISRLSRELGLPGIVPAKFY